MSRLNTSMFDSHASALLPARFSRHRFPFEAMSTPDVNIRKPRQWASCNAPHMLVCAGDVNTRKPPDKRLFFGLPQDTTVPPGALVMSHSSVWRRCPLGWAAWGEFGLRTSCVPSGQRTPLVSHGVTVGHLRPTPGHNVITPNQEGFMDSSWAPGLSQTNQQCSLSLKKNCAKMFCPSIREHPKPGAARSY